MKNARQLSSGRTSFDPDISQVSRFAHIVNIKGNDYRLVVAVDFEKSIVWIKWIGTHKNYDKIDVKEVRHGD
jgi:mRNA interferase HigB